MSNEDRAILETKPALTVAEFADYFGRSVRWAYDVVYRGEIKVLANSRLAMIPQGEVQRYINEVTEYSGRRKNFKSGAAGA